MLSEVLTALPSHRASSNEPARRDCVECGNDAGLDPVPYPGYDDVEDRARYVSLAFRLHESTAHFVEVFTGVLTALRPHTAPPCTKRESGLR